MTDIVLTIGLWACVYTGAMALTHKYFTVPQKRKDGKLVALEEKQQLAIKGDIISLWYSLVWTFIEVAIINWYGVSTYRESYWLERFFFWNTLGFFLYDLIARLWFGTLDMFILLHHFIGGSVCVYSLADGYISSWAWVGVFLFEVTHPFLVLNETLNAINYPQTSSLYLYNLWTFWFSFILCRSLTFYIYYLAVTGAHISILCVLVMGPNYVLTSFWMIRMVCKLWKTLPLWYKNPKQIENSSWWIYVSESMRKYTTQKPYSYFLEGTIYMCVLVYPITYAYYIRI